MKRAIIYIVVITTLFGCGERSLNYTEYASWLNEEDHGIVKTKEVNGIRLSVKYMPNELLAMRELGTAPAKKSTIDSLLAEYNESVTFLVTMSAKSQGDVMYKNIKNFKEYKDRMLIMNFELESLVSLKVDNQSYSPVLSSFENTYGLSDERNFIVVFAPASVQEERLLTASNYQFVYEDTQFGMGKNYFSFSKAELNNIPNLIYNEI